MSESRGIPCSVGRGSYQARVFDDWGISAAAVRERIRTNGIAIKVQAVAEALAESERARWYVCPEYGRYVTAAEETQDNMVFTLRVSGYLALSGQIHAAIPWDMFNELDAVAIARHIAEMTQELT